MSPFMSQLQSRLMSHPSDTDSHSDKNISLPSERIFECSLSSVVKFSTDDKNANGQNFFFFHLLKIFFYDVINQFPNQRRQSSPGSCTQWFAPTRYNHSLEECATELKLRWNSRQTVKGKKQRACHPNHRLLRTNWLTVSFFKFSRAGRWTKILISNFDPFSC